MDNNIFDLVCIGNYTKDTIISPKGVEHVDGGAVNYAAHAAASLGIRVAVVTHLAKEDERVVGFFNEAGIECFPTFTPYSTLMTLDYPTSNPDIRTLSVKHTAGSISPDEITKIGEIKAAVIGTSLRGEVGLDVIEALKEQKTIVAADGQGFIRVLEGESLNSRPWEEMKQTLALVTIFKTDAVEAEYLTGESDIRAAAKAFAAMGPAEIVLTHKDGLLVYAYGEFIDTKFYAKQLNGRSGRGDTCLGTYTAMRLSKQPDEAAIWAAALTSLKMEKQGPFDRTIEDVKALIKSRYNGKS
jgi:sugar/nucleoside kinase (ribokinase family)